MSSKNPMQEQVAIQWPNPSVKLPMDQRAVCKEFQYAVKVVCGNYDASPSENNIVIPGRYLTAVNIHNPATCKTVTFRWKVAIAKPLPLPPNALNSADDPVGGPVSRFRGISLRPDEAVEIDTPHILEIAKAIGGLLSGLAKGFVVIESPCELDVVAVYSAALITPAPNHSGSLAFHTERVGPRPFKPCGASIRQNISTGSVQWNLIQATDLVGAALAYPTPSPAIAMEDPNRLTSLWGTQSGSKWIGLNWTANVKNSTAPGFVPGFYTFQHCFNLCSQFESPTLDFGLLNDDAAQVWLNGNLLKDINGNTIWPGNLSGTPNRPQQPVTQFVPGQNCITVVVRNDVNTANPNPVGMNLNGVMIAEHAACAGDCGCCSD